MATAAVSSEIAQRRWRLRLPERLPALNGVWLTVYSICWMGLLAIALIGSIGGAVYRMESGAGETYSWGPLGLYLDDKGGIVRNVAGADAEKAGIRVGDAILTANGAAVPADDRSTSEQSLVLETALRGSVEGRPVRLTVARPGEQPRHVDVVKRMANAKLLYSHTGLTPFSVTLLSALGFLVAPLGLVGAASLLFTRRREAVPALLAISFLLGACTYGNILLFFVIDGSAAKFVNTLLGSFGAMGIVVALLTFPRGQFEPRWTSMVALLLPVFVVSGLVLPDLWWLDWIGRGTIVAGLLSMLIRYRRTAPEERQQWRWALLGFVIGIGFVVAWGTGYGAYLETHRGLGVDLWSWVLTPIPSALALLLMVGGVTLSVLRYRLYDTSAAVSRSAAYGILTLSFVALFAAVEKLTEIVGERYFEHSIGMAAGAIGAAVAAVCIVPLHNRVHRWAERRFQKPLIRMREGVPECVADLRDSASVEQIAEAVMKRVRAGVRSTREVILLREDGGLVAAGAHNVTEAEMRDWQTRWHQPAGEHVLDCDRKDALFPLRVRLTIETTDEPETIGWLLLGPRPDRSFFGKDEREAVEHVAGPVARAIHIAQLREEREEQAEKRLSALEALIEKLASAMHGGSRPAPA